MAHGLRRGTTGIVLATVLITTAQYIRLLLGGRKGYKGMGMTAHDAPKGILRKPMRKQLRKRKIIKPKYRTVKSI